MVRVRPSPQMTLRPVGRPRGVTGSDVTVSQNDSSGFRRPRGIASVRTRPSPQMTLMAFAGQEVLHRFKHDRAPKLLWWLSPSKRYCIGSNMTEPPNDLIRIAMFSLVRIRP